MLKKKLLIISILTILFIAVFHYLSLKYNWYWTYRWLDIPVHILSGFWVSLTVLLISLKIKHIDKIYEYKKKALLVMLISVLIISIFWEMFELIFKVTSLNSINYWQDSLGDILNGFIGGITAYLYFTKNKKAKCPIIDANIKNNFAITL
jgi:hypothetical protein